MIRETKEGITLYPVKAVLNEVQHYFVTDNEDIRHLAKMLVAAVGEIDRLTPKIKDKDAHDALIRMGAMPPQYPDQTWDILTVQKYIASLEKRKKV